MIEKIDRYMLCFMLNSSVRLLYGISTAGKHNMKYILITGGSSGIGYAVCKKFLENNYHVFAVSRSPGNLCNLAPNGTNLTFIQGDITHTQSSGNIIAALKEIDMKSNKIDIINNAAYGSPEPFKNIAITEIRKHFETNLFAPLQIIQDVLNLYNVDRVLNMSTGAAEHPFQSLFSYCTSKAAIHHAMKCLNLEYPDTKFTNLIPGLVNTPLLERWLELDDVTFPNKDYYIQAKAAHKLISVATVANFIFWVFNRPLDEFAAHDWHIHNEAHHKFWLNKPSLY